MKLKFKNSIIFFIVILLLSCGGNKELDEVMTPPKEKPKDIINVAPSIPTLIYPSNELFCIENKLEFNWTASTDSDGDSISYKIQIAEDEQFNNVVVEKLSSVNEIIVPLEKGKTFYWRILAIDNQDNSSGFTPTWNFYTEGEPIVNELPNTPELISPNLNEVVLETSTVLTWSAIDLDNDQLTYDIYFGLSTNPQLVVENSINISYEVGLSENRIYYWRIVAKDEYGGTSLSPIWSFSTE